METLGIILSILVIACVVWLVYRLVKRVEAAVDEKEQRHVEDDLIPMIGDDLTGVDLVEADDLLSERDDLTKLPHSRD